MGTERQMLMATIRSPDLGRGFGAKLEEIEDLSRAYFLKAPPAEKASLATALGDMVLEKDLFVRFASGVALAAAGRDAEPAKENVIKAYTGVQCLYSRLGYGPSGDEAEYYRNVLQTLDPEFLAKPLRPSVAECDDLIRTMGLNDREFLN